MEQTKIRCKGCKADVQMSGDYPVCPKCGHISGNKKTEYARITMCRLIFWDKTYPVPKKSWAARAGLCFLVISAYLFLLYWTTVEMPKPKILSSNSKFSVFLNLAAVAVPAVITVIICAMIIFSKRAKLHLIRAYSDLIRYRYGEVLDICRDFDRSTGLTDSVYIGEKYLFIDGGYVIPLSSVTVLTETGEPAELSPYTAETLPSGRTERLPGQSAEGHPAPRKNERIMTAMRYANGLIEVTESGRAVVSLNDSSGNDRLLKTISQYYKK